MITLSRNATLHFARQRISFVDLLCGSPVEGGMTRIEKDVFSENPYAAPAVSEAELIDESLLRARNDSIKRLVMVLGCAAVAETVITLVMTVIHSDSPRIQGINVYAVVHLFITGILATCMSWAVGMRGSVRISHVASQIGNALIWAAFFLTLFGAGMPLRMGEAWIFVTAFGISAGLCLLATWLSLRVHG
jgi:hypothetical protein